MSLSPNALTGLIDRAQALGIGDQFVNISHEVDYYSDPRIVAGGVSIRTTVEPPLLEVYFDGIGPRGERGRTDRLTLVNGQVESNSTAASSSPSDRDIYKLARGCIKAAEYAKQRSTDGTGLRFLEIQLATAESQTAV